MEKDKMFEKYIMIKDKQIIAKQTSNGLWYCSELPANSVEELDLLISKVNNVLNKYNKGEENGSSTSISPKKPRVRM